MPRRRVRGPRAARVAREAARQSFDNAARALNVGWGTTPDGKQVQRWGEAPGRTLVDRRGAELAALARGEPPACKATEPQVLVIGMDGGRVQTRDADAETGSRWREEKVPTVTSCLTGDGGERPPAKLLTTTVATMADAHAFGEVARPEAERRGVRRAVEVVGIHDGGNRIDPLWERHFPAHQRILDYYHAAEHLHEAARAATATATATTPLADRLVGLLWDGRADELIGEPAALSGSAGPPAESDAKDHPRRVLAANVEYFRRHRGHVDYPAYRARGWPVGSSITGSGVKLSGKRVKGTEQFWSVGGAEAILALRGKWLSEDEDSNRYWLGRPPGKAAA